MTFSLEQEQVTVNMNTNGNKPLLENALAAVPKSLRQKLIVTYQELKAAFIEGRFESCGLRAGKFCEIAIRVLQHSLTAAYLPLADKLPNYKAQCEAIEQLSSSTGPESLRILMPRALSFLYTLRNKRGIGHVGEIDANEIDAATCVRLADWCLTEFIRVAHKLSIEEAQALVDSIAERRVPLLWEIQGKKRILKHDLGYKPTVLLLLYSEPINGVALEDLLAWTDNPRKDNFLRTVILPLHKTRLIEYDRENELIFISPLGNQRVEEEILPSVS
jgi:hypothetical protein